MYMSSGGPRHHRRRPLLPSLRGSAIATSLPKGAITVWVTVVGPGALQFVFGKEGGRGPLEVDLFTADPLALRQSDL